MTRRQCKQCPWKVGSNPRDIPGEYSEDRHRALESTIARDTLFGDALRMMACHETMPGKELPCVGWMHHQLGAGNNIMLRFAVISGRVNGDVEVVGPQHERFEDTLP
ncbi:MAG TPA: DUF6283 family protein [Thermoanaerobaculia bacterium]|nr:DUF6283 family protein [Thermoanaerobaculia bacterium]